MRYSIKPLFVVLPLALILSACEPASEAQAPEIARPVRVAEVVPAPDSRALRLPATVRAVARVAPAFLQPGVVAERPVQRGQILAAGERLARLDNPSLQPNAERAESRLAEVEEQLAQAERELVRANRLRESGSVSADQLDRLKSQRDSLRDARSQAEAALQEAQNQLASADLRAPFAARVLAVHVEPGDFVAAGHPVVTLAGVEQGFEVQMFLPARVAAAIAPGHTVAVSASPDGQAQLAEVREITQTSGFGSASVLANLPQDGDWFSGQSVHADLRWQAEDLSRAMQLPLPALSSNGDGQVRVFRLAEGERVERLTVISGAVNDGQALVYAAPQESRQLQAGDQVVVAGQFGLAEGDTVKVLP
jgi:multidrug efflux system membrane fusion protein